MFYQWAAWVAQWFSTAFGPGRVILETQDRVPHWAPCTEPASPSACVSASLSLSLLSLSLSVCASLMNKLDL